MTRMRLASLLAILLASAGVKFALGAAAGPRGGAEQNPAPQPALAEPGISPDGSEIAFVSGGDIWTVPAMGGEARLLVSHPATESRPLYSPDGEKLAFVSTRTGNGDIYVLTFATGQLARLTWDDDLDQLDGWSRDGRWIYFTTTSRDISGMGDIYRVSAEGGTPMPVAADRYASEFFSAPAPDGKTLAISARGIARAQWWRKGHSHLDESEIWLVHEGAPPTYESLTPGGAKQLWPMWSADGKDIYYVSDRSGAQNIWVQPMGGAARPVTQFKDGRVVWPSISADGRAIAFERDFGIWKLDTATGRAAHVPITLRGTPAGPATEHLTLSHGFGDLALSPDGKKIAFTAHGEIFAASAKDGGQAARVTFTPAAIESEIAWAPDSRRIVYTSDRDGGEHIFLYDFVANAETQLTSAAEPDSVPRFSPDGKLIAFERGGHELCVLDLDAKKERVVANGLFDRPPFGPDRALVFSPDGKWIGYLALDESNFRNLFAVPAAGGDPHPASFLSNVFSNDLSWSPDGTYLLTTSGQRTEPSIVARVDLIPRPPKFREDQFRDLFKEEPKKPSGGAGIGEGATAEKKPAAKPVEIVWEGIRGRMRVVPTGLDADAEAISPDGKWLLITARVADQPNLYLYSLDELAKEPPVARQLTSTPGGKSDAQFTPDSKEVYYLERGTIHAITVESRQARSVDVTAEMDTDFASEKREVFEEAWRAQRDWFFDPGHNGVNWNAVHDEYAPRVAAAATHDELRRLLNLMVGELNASHSGASAPGPIERTTGRIGLAFDRGEYEATGRLKITEVLPLGPAALAGGIQTGDYLLAVNGNPTGARVNLDELLDHTIGRRTVLTVASSADEAGKHDVVVLPVSLFAEKDLRYEQWVAERRAYVAKISDGRLGYVHMPDMSSESLEKLYLDLDTENRARQGIVIDIRNNNGGFVNVYAIDVLARRGYLTMTPRGFPPSAARTELGQRALERPTVLVVNQHSLSDAEDFTEGYRALHLGKVVGEPTAGWIIYTSGIRLLDGTILRMPFIRITDAEGKPMEMHPRPVDVPVVRPLGESYTGRDAQLDAAVRTLIDQIGAAAKK